MRIAICDILKKLSSDKSCIRVGIEGAMRGNNCEMLKRLLGDLGDLDGTYAEELLNKVCRIRSGDEIVKVVIDAVSKSVMCSWGHFVKRMYVDRRMSVLLYAFRTVDLNYVFNGWVSFVYIHVSELFNQTICWNDFLSFFEFVCRDGNVEMVETLIRYGNFAEMCICEALKIACMMRHMCMLDRMIVLAMEYRVYVNWDYMLNFACDAEVLKYIVDLGVVLNVRKMYEVHSVMCDFIGDYECEYERRCGKIEYLMSFDCFDFGHAMALERRRLDSCAMAMATGRNRLDDCDDCVEMQCASNLMMLEEGKSKLEREKKNNKKRHTDKLCVGKSVSQMDGSSKYELVKYCSVHDELFMMHTDASMFRTREDLRRKLIQLMPCVSRDVVRKRLNVRVSKKDEVIGAVIVRLMLIMG